MRPPGADGEGGGGGLPATRSSPHDRSEQGFLGLRPIFPRGGGQMRSAGCVGDGGGGVLPATGGDERGRSGPGDHDLLRFYPGGGGLIGEPPRGDGDGEYGGQPLTRTSTIESEDPISFTQLADEAWMGRSMVSLIAGTQESVNFVHCVHSQVDGNMEDHQVQAEQFVEAEEWSDEESESDVEDFTVHCEGDTDVDELYPTPTYEELVVEEVPKSKEELHKENKANQAKLRAVTTRKVKKRAADYEAGVKEEPMTFSDQDSEDCRDLSDSSEDDGVVPKTSLSITKRTSRAKKMQKRIYYDESRENAHDQMCVHMCFADVHQCRRALVNHHILNCRDYEFLENTPSRIVVCCKSDGTCAFTMTTSIIKGEKTHCIRQLVMPHTCGTTTSAIYARRHDHPEDHVSDFFKKPCYQKAYQEIIFPVPGQHDWTKTDSPDIEPPIFTRQPGRKKKKRRLGPTETTHNSSGYVASITCSNCKLKGHRYTTCTVPLKSHLLVRKQQHKSNRRFPSPFVPPSLNAQPTSSTTHPSSAATGTRQTSIPPMPQSQAPPRAPWIPPRHGAPTHAPPHGQQREGGYLNSRIYSYFTPGLEALNQQEE